MRCACATCEMGYARATYVLAMLHFLDSLPCIESRKLD